MTYQQLIENMTPELYQALKRAVELGRWPDQRALTQDQRETCLRAVIHFEKTRIKDDRAHTGYLQRPCQGQAANAPAADIIARQTDNN